MKYLILKLSIVLSLLIAVNAFGQSPLEDELLLQTDDYHPDLAWESQFKDNNDHLDNNHSKTYGTENGTYYLYLPASSAAPTFAISKYEGAGCISRTPDHLANRFYLQLQLPDGHEIQSLRFFYKTKSYNTSSAFLITMSNEGVENTLAHVYSYKNYNGLISEITPGHIVNNIHFRYVIRFYVNETNSDEQICGVQLKLNSNP